MSTKKRVAEEQDIMEEEEEDVCGSVASRRSTAGTGVVTSVHSGAVPFHRFPSMHARGSRLVRIWSRGHRKVATVPSYESSTDPGDGAGGVGHPGIRQTGTCLLQDPVIWQIALLVSGTFT